MFKAIGQSFEAADAQRQRRSIALEAGRIKVDAEGRTSLAKVWAGGDCVVGGEDLTVSAVAQGPRRGRKHPSGTHAANGRA